MSNQTVLVAFLALSGILIPDGIGFASAKPKPFGFIRDIIFGPTQAPPPPQPISVYVAPINNAQYNQGMPPPPPPPQPPQPPQPFGGQNPNQMYQNQQQPPQYG